MVTRFSYAHATFLHGIFYEFLFFLIAAISNLKRQTNYLHYTKGDEILLQISEKELLSADLAAKNRFPKNSAKELELLQKIWALENYILT